MIATFILAACIAFAVFVVSYAIVFTVVSLAILAHWSAAFLGAVVVIVIVILLAQWCSGELKGGDDTQHGR